ncbi:MAG: STAS domain-containing protein [Xanthomonadales bacterium]|nr:STAS domain-containing protein [Xanthomonadales bacterium]
MFEIYRTDEGTIRFDGRLDASQCDRAKAFLDGLSGNVSADLQGLTYLSSAGMGVLLRTQKRLIDSGGAVRLHNVSRHIFDIFFFSGFSKVFEIDIAEDNP